MHAGGSGVRLDDGPDITKVPSNGYGHMTKMAAMPIYGKILKLGMQHRVLEYYQTPSNDDPGLTLTYFTARSNLVPYAFVWEKVKTMDFFRNYCNL